MGQAKIKNEEDRIGYLNKNLTRTKLYLPEFETDPGYIIRNQEYDKLMAKKTEREEMNKNLVSAQQEEQKATLDDIRSRASPYGGKSKKTKKSKKTRKSKKTKKNRKTKKSRKSKKSRRM